MGVALSIVGYAAPITTKDAGLIWVCGKYMVWAEQNAKTVDLSKQETKLDIKLNYDAKKDTYFSKDKKHTLQFKGKDLNAPKVIFQIDGKSHNCYYEYIERG